MLAEAFELQNEAVTMLCDEVLQKDEIVFRAPTGSGKTHMMADFINRQIENDANMLFIVSSLSKGELAKQNYDNFVLYSRNEFTLIDPFLISSETTSEERLDVEEGHNVYVLPRDLYKEKSKLKEGGVFVGFLENEIKKGKRIILIKDECHIATKNLDELSKYFNKIINMSATPKLSRGQYPDICINDSDAVATKLIKDTKYMEYKNDNDLESSLDEALSFFEDKKPLYLQKGVAPCIIIQISNKEKADEEWKTISHVLNSKHSSLKWMLIVNNSKDGREDGVKCDTNDEIKVKKGVPVSKWKDYAKGNASTIDVVVFKMVISEGWDIPRACMLFQVRDSQSTQLTEQVIGRVRRNPLLLKYNRNNADELDFLMTAYIWGVRENYEQRTISIFPQETDPSIIDSLKIKTTYIQDIKETNEKTDLIIDEVLEKSSTPLVSPSVFELYKDYRKTNDELKEACSDFVNNKNESEDQEFQIWISIMQNVSSISNEITEYRGNYKNNLELGDTVSIQDSTSYNENKEYEAYLDDWMWRKTDEDDADYSFDSDAEKDWANILQKVARKYADSLEKSDGDDVFLWGKNYTFKSMIKYDYYLRGIHSSYPDFILKDNSGCIHLFEVKSVNKSSKISIDKDDYEEKIRALMECYKYTAEFIGYHFWIPIRIQSDWVIYHYEEGNEEKMTLREFRDYFKNK